MHIDIIDTVTQLETLKENWNAVYAEDQSTTIFVSWGWMRGWLEITPYKWIILAIRPDSTSSYVAFMPLGIECIQKGMFHSFRKLVIGGDKWSDNTGFICLPEYVETAVPLLATFIQKYISWDIFSLRNVFDSRLESFLRCFSHKKFTVSEHTATSCPYFVLPGNYNQYLQGFLGAQTRSDLKRDTRKVEDLNEFRSMQVQTENLGTQTETLLMLWQARWGLKPAHILHSYRMLFLRCFEDNSLWLTTLWTGATPIAGAAAFLDRKTKTFRCYTTAFNKEYMKLSPGKVMQGYSIRHAIESGFQVYDLGAGSESYKFSFGSRERFNRNILIKHRSLLKKLKNKFTVNILRRELPYERHIWIRNTK